MRTYIEKEDSLQRFSVCGLLMSFYLEVWLCAKVQIVFTLLSDPS